jgi:hypothetical protein
MLAVPYSPSATWIIVLVTVEVAAASKDCLVEGHTGDRVRATDRPPFGHS